MKDSIQNKSQASFEVVILITVLLSIFMIAMYFSQNMMLDAQRSQLKQQAISIVETLASGIDEVTLMGEGSNKIVFLPTNMTPNIVYQVRVIPEYRLVDIQWLGKHFSTNYAFDNVSGRLNFTGGQVNLTNNGTSIVLA